MMRKPKTIPEGYMTVGEVVRKMNTTVRTLQFYDKEGVLSPSAESEGGRRLYSDKDIIRLRQIQSMEFLGFSISDIKGRLVCIKTPESAAEEPVVPAEAVRKKIAPLPEASGEAETQREEVLGMKAAGRGK